MATATDQQILETAQAKLLHMREEHKATDLRGRSLQYSDLTEAIASCRRKSEALRESGAFIVSDSQREEPKSGSILSYCGVDRKYRNCTFESFRGGAQLVEKLRRLTEGGQSVILSGNTGCGKTHLAVAMMSEFLKGKSISALFVTLPELLLEIRSSFSERSTTTEKSLVERFSSKQFLVLDDLGAEKPSEFTVATLYLILDRRIRQERQTIITTNLMNMDAITEYAGARIASRISEMELIKVNMPDYRKLRKKRG